MKEPSEESTVKVYLFYSSTTDPAFPSRFQECIAFCREQGLAVEVVDISKSPETAQRFEVIATPALVTVNQEGVHRHIGVMAEYKEIIREDFSLGSTD